MNRIIIAGLFLLATLPLTAATRLPRADGVFVVPHSTWLTGSNILYGVAAAGGAHPSTQNSNVFFKNYESVAISDTNHPVDFNVRRKVITATHWAVKFVHSTNGNNANGESSLFMVRTGNTNRHVYFNPAWECVDGSRAPSLLASNTPYFFMFDTTTNNESGVTFTWWSKGTNELSDYGIFQALLDATNRLHQVVGSVIGGGTDYTLTDTEARVDFGTTDAQVTLPTAGTYEVTATITVLSSATAGDVIQFVLYNSTDSAVGGRRATWTAPASSYQTLTFSEFWTVAASKVIQIRGINYTAVGSPRGSVRSDLTWLNYKRLYQ